MKGESSANPERRSGPDNLAYVIYTSGTTGRPKGVMIEHRGVVNLIVNQGKEFGLYDQKEKIRCLWYANYVFDAHVSELFTALGNGHSIYITSEEMRMDIGLLSAYIKSNEIKIATIPPVLLDSETTIALETIVVAGEACGKKVMDSYREKGVRVINAYGPTETTVCASLHHYEKGDIHTVIGRAIGNVTLYILDGNLRPLPVGAAGELYIGGDGVARGYLNEAELTAEKFVANPFQSAEERNCGHNGVLYRTGDMARYLPDGNIEYIGRNDFQVKIRGYRIELGEIESRLLEYEGIKQAVVAAKERGGSKYLAAYYVSEYELEKAALRTHLEDLLPDYMVPDTFTHLKKLPITINGKIDIHNLPDPELDGGEEHVFPANETEERLLVVFGQVLGLEKEKISVTDNFFRLGGNSILAIKLASRLQSDLGVSIRIADIASLKTIRKIAENAGLKARAHLEIEPALFKSVGEQLLSFEQGRLWFLHNYESSNNVYNIPIVKIIKQGVKIEHLKEAITETLRRHEVLRSVIKTNKDGEAYQAAIDEKEYPFEIAEKVSDNSDVLQTEIAEEVGHVFDLGKEYPIRITIYMEGNNRYMVAVIHHIAFDGWSNDIFMEDIIRLYHYYESEERWPYPLQRLKIQYKDYAVWQRKYLKEDAFNRQLAYWKEKIAGYEMLNLVTDKPRPMYIQYEGDEVEFKFDEKTSLRIRETAMDLEVSLYTVLLSAYYIMLSTYSNQKDIVIGTLMANRQHAEASGLIGYFVNTMALRQIIDREKEITSFIKEVGDDVIAAQENQEAPFEKLLDELKVTKDTSRSPLFQAMFTMDGFGKDTGGINGIFDEPAVIENKNKTAKFDISLIMEDREDSCIKGAFNYAVSIFDRKTIELYLDSYKTIVSQITDHIGRGSKKIKDIRVLDKEQYEQIIYKWNRTEQTYPKGKTVHQLFEEQVLRTPEHTAVVFENKRLTYRELNEESNRLAHYLLNEYHIQADDMVALCLNSNEKMLIAIMAVLKTGGAYTPIMSDYPPDRIQYMVEDTGAKVVLSNDDHVPKLQKLLGEKTVIESIDSKAFMEKIASESLANPSSQSGAGNLAYTIYTSGTTGRPKGVMIEHRGVPNLILSLHSLYGFSGSGEVVLLFANYGFDPSVEQMFLALLNGHTLVVPKENMWMDETAFIGYLRREKVTHIQMTPSLLRQINLRDVDSLKRVVVVGEAVTNELLEDIKDRKFAFINSYGPTEITVIATVNAGGKTKYIGRPIANTTCYILDENLQPLPVGAIGELYIGGVGVARGYLNQPEMTAERFIDNPFQTDKQKAAMFNGVLYKTGDLARYLPDGTIDYIGRNDFQVKIRGLRIELGEIEGRLLLYPGIREAVALAKDRQASPGQTDHADLYLAAYYVSDQKLDENLLRAFLEEAMLEHMIPSAFIHLYKFPLTKNGKLDRRALPEPEIKDREENIGPSNNVEKKLCALYAEILNLDAASVSVTADFFKLGGDSIRSIQLANLIRRQFKYPIKIKDIFTYRSVRRLYENLFSLEPEGRFIQTEQGLLSGEFPLLPAQRFFFYNMSAGRISAGYYHAYATFYFLEIEDIDEAVFAESLYKLVEYHDAFRLGFKIKTDGSVAQYYCDGMPEIKIDKHTIVSPGAKERSNETEKIISAWTGKMDIFQGPLFLFGCIVGIDKGKSGVYLMAHHLITDGVSWRIVGSDFAAIYNYLKAHKENIKNTSAEEILGPKGTSCRQWIQALSEYGRLEEADAGYWASVLEAARETNRQTAALSTHQLNERVFLITNELTERILRMSRRGLETRIDDILLAALDMALSIAAGITEPCILMETHGRQEIAEAIDISRTMGWFASSYPVKLPRFNGNVKELALKVKETLRETPNEGIGANALSLHQHDTLERLPKIYFNYQGEYESGVDSNIKIETTANGEAADVNGFDISISVHAAGGQFKFTVLSKLPDDRASRFGQAIEEALEMVVAEIKDCENK
jgi:amino acid adenylation domain-containing protein